MLSLESQHAGLCFQVSKGPMSTLSSAASQGLRQPDRVTVGWDQCLLGCPMVSLHPELQAGLVEVSVVECHRDGYVPHVR